MNLEAILQRLMSLFSGGIPGSAGFTPYNGAPAFGKGQIDTSALPAWLDPGAIAAVGPVAGAGGSGSGDWLSTLLSLATAATGGYYGGQELRNKADIYNLQRQAVATALGLNPAMLPAQAARAALPINKTLAYQVNQAADANTARGGMAQSPGAVAAAEAGALAPYAQRNLQLGANLATTADQVALDKARVPFWLHAPDYMSVLDQLNQAGRNEASMPAGTYSLPDGTGF